MRLVKVLVCPAHVVRLHQLTEQDACISHRSFGATYELYNGQGQEQEQKDLPSLASAGTSLQHLGRVPSGLAIRD